MTRKRILVPVDFSTQSDLALEYARDIAKRLDALISCIYVIEEHGFLTDDLPGFDLRHKLRREAENKLSERVNLILNGEEKIHFELIITSGKVYQKVLEKSIDLKALMIVIGRSSSARTSNTKIGSNAVKIVSQSLVPVVVVDKQGPGNAKRLIFPIDLEKSYSDKLDRAVEMALLLGASVSVISVIDKERFGLRPVYLNKLKEIGYTFRAQNIVFDTHLLENKTTISREILKFSNSIENGIILLMTHHEKKPDRSYLGLTESEVFNGAKLPVLFLNPGITFRFSMLESREADHFI